MRGMFVKFVGIRITMQAWMQARVSAWMQARVSAWMRASVLAFCASLLALTALAEITPDYTPDNHAFPNQDFSQANQPPDPPIIRTSYGMVLPQPRPDPRNILPKTEPSLRVFLQKQLGQKQLGQKQSGQNIKTEATLYTLKSGEGLAPLLKRAGLNEQMRNTAIQAIQAYRPLHNLPVGFQVHAIIIANSPDSLGGGASTTAASTTAALRIALNDEQDLSLFYDQTRQDWHSTRSYRPYQSFETFISGSIDNSLYAASIEAGINEQIFNQFTQIMGFSVDFQRQIRQGDTFKILIKRRRDLVTDEVLKGGEMQFLSLTLSDENIAFYRHESTDGKVGYYDRTGTSAYRTLMRTPINGARLSSGYGNRRHPILGYTKAHRGVDFAAPTGTPIMAAGNGIVEFAGWNGSYGRYVRIRHHGTYKTAYAHLARINKKIRVGAHINQGEIIGTVGSSGRSTGPHLHYEILLNGRQVNPLTVNLPTGEDLNKAEMHRFTKTVRTTNAKINRPRFAEKQ